MYLYKDEETFQQLLILTSEHFQRSEAVIEKDDYVSVILQAISERIPEIIFKGGTSLSKAYQLIDRFSEDIDLSFYQANLSPPSDAQRRQLKRDILGAVAETGLTVTNLEEIQSRRKFNRYEVEYANKYVDSHLKSYLPIETYCHFVPYPTEKTPVSNYIYEYLLNQDRNDVIEQFNELLPFTMTLQSLNRTFIDKCFALCDRFELQDSVGSSRHLYDLYYLWPLIEDRREELRILYQSVKADLSGDLIRNPSCAPKYPFTLKLVE